MDGDGAVIGWTRWGIEPTDSCESAFPGRSRCYSRRVIPTTDLHTIDCKGIDPSRVQSLVDALTESVEMAWSLERLETYEDDSEPQPNDCGCRR